MECSEAFSGCSCSPTKNLSSSSWHFFSLHTRACLTNWRITLQLKQFKVVFFNLENDYICNHWNLSFSLLDFFIWKRDWRLKEWLKRRSFLLIPCPMISHPPLMAELSEDQVRQPQSINPLCQWKQYLVCNETWDYLIDGDCNSICDLSLTFKFPYFSRKTFTSNWHEVSEHKTSQDS